MRTNLKVGFVGLTHLGLTYLEASSKKGFKVKGIDLNQNKINLTEKLIKNIERDERLIKRQIDELQINIMKTEKLIQETQKVNQ